jgi:hypothetical protein
MWEILKEVNRMLDAAEEMLGEKFRSRYCTKIGPIDGDSVEVIIFDRGNGFDVASITFNLSSEPSQIAEQFRKVLAL